MALLSREITELSAAVKEQISVASIAADLQTAIQRVEDRTFMAPTYFDGLPFPLPASLVADMTPNWRTHPGFISALTASVCGSALRAVVDVTGVNIGNFSEEQIFEFTALTNDMEAEVLQQYFAGHS